MTSFSSFSRVLTGEGHAVAAAHGMADEDELVEGQSIAEGGQVGHVGVGGVVAVFGPIAVAAATLVQGEDVVVVAQGGGNVVPGMGVAAQAVDQQGYRLAHRAPVQVVEGMAVGGYGLALGFDLGSHGVCLRLQHLA